MVRIGVVGYGYWGPNLVRNFSGTGGSQVVAVSDLRAERRALAQQRDPSIKAVADYREIVQASDIDAVAIATPIATHFEVADAALKAGKHVFVEKPLAESSEAAERLAETAAARGLTLMVDHIFCFTEPVRKVRQLIQAGELGDLFYYDSIRINLGLFQHDANVIWDLAIHDVSILDHVIDERPVAVSAHGAGHIPGSHEDVAYLTLFYPSKFIAHINVNWLAPAKVRTTLIGGSRRMIRYDDLDQSEKIKIYDKGVTIAADKQQIYDMLVAYRIGDMWSPRLPDSEPLAESARHFLSCIASKTQPLSGAESALRCIRVLEAATESMKRQGAPMPLAS